MKRFDLPLKKTCIGLLLGLVTLNLLASPLAQSEEAAVPKLQDLKTFEVEQFHSGFDLRNYHLDGEFYMHLNNALEHDKRFKMASPGEGIIHLTCQWAECTRIKASVTVGHDGPEVWSKTFGAYDMFNTYWFGNYQKNPRRMSKQILRELAEAYRGETAK